MDVKNNEIFLTQGIGFPFLFWYLTVNVCKKYYM